MPVAEPASAVMAAFDREVLVEGAMLGPVLEGLADPSPPSPHPMTLLPVQPVFRLWSVLHIVPVMTGNRLAGGLYSSLGFFSGYCKKSWTMRQQQVNKCLWTTVVGGQEYHGVKVNRD